LLRGGGERADQGAEKANETRERASIHYSITPSARGAGW
jgi:hypothetical protein